MKKTHKRIDERQLYRLAYMYVIDNKTQEEIGRLTKLGQPLINRILREAESRGIIKKNIEPPKSNYAIELELMRKFKLRDCIVIPYPDFGGIDDHIIRKGLLAQVMAFKFEQILERVKLDSSHKGVGVSCGTTVGSMPPCLTEGKFRNLNFYSLISEDSPDVGITQTGLITAFLMAERYSPTCKAHGLHFPKTNQEKIDRYFEEIEGNVDIFLLGIGSLEGSVSPDFVNFFKSAGLQIEDLKEEGTVGECCFQPFDSEGRFLLKNSKKLESLYKNLIVYDLNKIRKVVEQDVPEKWVIAGAGGSHKVNAIRGAMKAKLLNILVTDEETATKLLRED